MQSEAHVPWFRVVFEMTDGSLMEFQMQQGDFRELEKGDQLDKLLIKVQCK